mmetsp:Transcript_11473/g.39146  ORF Transcript_11473/g.39146 Transcript_11473/m.39146 type:complete len:266 (+) Transcript_11473:1171-1968(+)
MVEPTAAEGGPPGPARDEDELGVPLTQAPEGPALPGDAVPATQAPALRQAGVPRRARLVALNSAVADIVLDRPEINIGRGQEAGAGSVNLTDPQRTDGAQLVSRKHATIRRTDCGWCIVDRRSTHGTLHNGVPLPPDAAMDIDEDDEITFGARQLGTDDDYIYFKFRAEGLAPRAEETYVRTVQQLLAGAHARAQAVDGTRDITSLEREVGQLITSLRRAYDGLNQRRARRQGQQRQQRYAQRDGARRAARVDRGAHKDKRSRHS